MKFCIILFSNADSSYKEKILKKNLSSLHKLHLPIILVSHCPISIEIQNECEYVVFERNNFLLKETDFFDEEIPLSEANFNTQYFFGGISTRCYVHKKTYAPAVVNLYINGFGMAKSLGFEYGILWEYDFEMDEKMCDNITSLIEEVTEKKLDGFFITCQISGINCIQAVPSIFPINKFCNYLPEKILETAGDYIKEIKMMISEEWIYNFYKTLENPKVLPLEEYFSLYTPGRSNQISSGMENPLFYGLNSGVFVDKKDKGSWVFSVYNGSTITVSYSYKLIFKGVEIDSCESEIIPRQWRYNFINREISQEILNSDLSLKVFENIKYDHFSETYEYEVNRNNIDSISKGKVFFHL